MLLLYVGVIKLTIRTNQDSSKWNHIVVQASGLMARWRNHLSEFSLKITNRNSINNQAADGPLRLETTTKYAASISCGLSITNIDLE